VGHNEQGHDQGHKGQEKVSCFIKEGHKLSNRIVIMSASLIEAFEEMRVHSRGVSFALSTEVPNLLTS
jgi:hypothetical protein